MTYAWKSEAEGLQFEGQPRLCSEKTTLKLTIKELQMANKHMKRWGTASQNDKILGFL